MGSIWIWWYLNFKEDNCSEKVPENTEARGTCRTTLWSGSHRKPDWGETTGQDLEFFNRQTVRKERNEGGIWGVNQS